MVKDSGEIVEYLLEDELLEEFEELLVTASATEDRFECEPPDGRVLLGKIDGGKSRQDEAEALFRRLCMTGEFEGWRYIYLQVTLDGKAIAVDLGRCQRQPWRSAAHGGTAASLPTDTADGEGDES